LPLPYTARLSETVVLGKLSAQVDLKGTPLKPRGEAVVALKGVTRGRSKPMDVSAKLLARPKDFAVQVTGNIDGVKVLYAEGKLKEDLADLRKPAGLERAPFSLTATLGPWELTHLLSLVQDPHQRTRDQLRLSGTLKGELEAKGPMRAPTVKLRTSLTQLAARSGERRGNVNVSYDYDDTRHVLVAALTDETGGKVALEARTTLDVSMAGLKRGLVLAEMPLVAELMAQDFKPAFLSGASPALRKVGGVLVGSGRVSGTVGTPTAEGELEWKNGELALGGNGDLKDIHLKVSGNREKIELSDLFARSGRGEAKLTATATRRGTEYALVGYADLKEFPVITGDQLMATLSVKVETEGKAGKGLIDLARLHIPEAHIELPKVQAKNLQKLGPPEGIVFVRRGVPVEEQKGVGGSGGEGTKDASAAKSGFQFRARVDAPRNLWVKGDDVNVEVGMDEGFRVEVKEEAQLFGRVRVLRGRIEAFGRRFDLEQDSAVVFNGAPTRPTLDVTAQHVNERADATVVLRVHGPTTNLQIQTSSTPPMSETEIYTLLATGRRKLRPGSGGASGGAAASVVGSLVAAQLKNVLSETLPLDVLSIEAGDTGLAGTKVEAGTYLGDRAYVGFSSRFGADIEDGENANSVRLEYQIGKRWALEAEYGDANAGGADLVWSKDY
jgi:translocation and assembly module TamB